MATDDKATFVVDLQATGKSPVVEMSSALKDLRAKLQEDTAALGEMQKALRNLKGGGAVAQAQFEQLSARIKAQKATIAQTQSKYLELGGSFKNLKSSGSQASGALGTFAERAKASGGPLGTFSNRLGGVVELLGGGFTAAAAAGAVALLALVAAVVAATVALGAYGLAQANAHRNELLTLEGLTKVRNYYGLAAGSASEMQAAITKVAASSALGRDRIAGLEQGLYRMGLRGQNLTDALEGVAIATSAAGEGQGQLYAGQIALAARSGVAVKGLTNEIKNRFGGVARAQLLDLNVQTAKLHESFAALFQDLHIEGVLEALHSVTELFSQNTNSGKALKLLVETLFQPLFGQIGEAGPLARNFFQGIIIATLRTAIAIQQTRLWFRRTFGAPDILKGVNATKEALLIGQAVLYGFGAALAIVAAAIALVVAGLAAMLSPIQTAKALFGGLGDYLAGLNWRQLGSNLVDGFINGINAGISRVVSTVKNLGNAALEALRHSLDSHSPSRLTFGIGNIGVAGGLALGQQAGIPRVRASAGGLGRAALGGLGSELDRGSARARGDSAFGSAAPRRAAGPRVHIENLNCHGGEPRERAQSTKDALLETLSQIGASIGAAIDPEVASA